MIKNIKQISYTLTKFDIINKVYKKTNFSKKKSGIIVEDIFETIKKVLENGKNVKLSGFGNFKTRQKDSRRGRNPKNGKEIKISARKVLFFKASQILKNLLNKK